MTKPAAVITCSDTASVNPSADRSGPLAVTMLLEAGFSARPATIVPDESVMIAASVRQAVEAGTRIIVCTGGTGIGPRDVTPEAVQTLGGRELPGVGEAIRAAARSAVPTADLSRSGAVIVSSSIVLMLPGSTGGVRDGLSVALPLMHHALGMMDGATHGGSPDIAVSHGARVDNTHGGSPEASGADALVAPARIDQDAVTSPVRASAAGAVATFEGRVRDHDHGRTVTALVYEAHPSAGEVLAQVIRESTTRPGVIAAAARHRVGDLAVGDLTFFVAVSAAHRQEAFDACAWLVDEAKDRLPIWKHQVFADGTSEWVNCP